MGWMAPGRHRCAKMVVVEDHQQREPSMGDITTIGLDLAKNVFQVHAVDEAGNNQLPANVSGGIATVALTGLIPNLHQSDLTM
jgi:hypothetical protein